MEFHFSNVYYGEKAEIVVVFNQLIKQDEIYRQVRSLCKEEICQVRYRYMHGFQTRFKSLAKNYGFFSN